MRNSAGDPNMLTCRSRGMKHIFAAALMAVGLSAQAKAPNFTEPTTFGPDLNLEEYFDGNLTATGEFYNGRGKLARSFVADVDGSWDGTTLTLDERFVYNDGQEQRRVWYLTKTGDDAWEGRADDVVGVAEGIESGPVFTWSYFIDLPTKNGNSVKVKFDDILWRVSDSEVVNKAVIKKFGIGFGEVIITFKKN